VTNVVLSFKEAGLGNENITFVCVNPDGQSPNGASGKTVTTERSAEATLRPENGRVTASFMLTPPPRSDFCPSGQTEQLAETSFTNIDYGPHQPRLEDCDAHYDRGDVVHVSLSLSTVIPQRGGREQFQPLLQPSGALGAVGVTC
jgi:hypothetical protein